MTHSDWNEITAKLEGVLARLGDHLPQPDRENVSRFIQAGEYGVAFETLCTQIHEYDVAPDREDLARLAEVGLRLGLDPTLWKVLAE